MMRVIKCAAGLILTIAPEKGVAAWTVVAGTTSVLKGHIKARFKAFEGRLALEQGYSERAHRAVGAFVLLATIAVAPVDLGAQATNVSISTSSSLPAQAIEDGWEAGSRITSVTGASNGYWTVVMSNRSGYRGQAHSGTSSSWPSTFIREQWDLGRRITEVAYCNGRWHVVSSGGLDWVQQWSTGRSLSSELQEHRSVGNHITDVAYGGGLWAVVSSKVPSFGAQVYTVSSSYPSSFITENLNNGYHITEWYYGNGTWVVVMTRLTSWPAQGVDEWSSFDDATDGDNEILDLVYFGASYYYVTTQNLGEALGFPPPSGGVLETDVASSTGSAATFTIDVFAVGSDSELLNLGSGDFAITDGEIGSTGTYLEYRLTDVELYRQRDAGPYSALFLLDQSGSITGTDPTDARIEAAKVFIQGLGTGDEVGLMAFASDGRLPYSPTTSWTESGQRFSRSRAAFFGALDSLADTEDGNTPLYDATQSAVNFVDTYANNTNQVVVVFTDGDDTSSSSDLSDAIQYARQRGVPLHTVALSQGVDIGVLSRMAAETGGSLTHAADARRLISYYGALGPYLSGSGLFYRTTWALRAHGGTFNLSRGSGLQHTVEIEIPGTNIYLPFRLSF